MDIREASAGRDQILEQVRGAVIVLHREPLARLGQQMVRADLHRWHDLGEWQSGRFPASGPRGEHAGPEAE
jgi:hypothetical protein